MNAIARPIRKYPLTVFFVLACLFGWVLFIWNAIDAGVEANGFPIGPIIAAGIVTAALGRAELLAWARRLVRLRAASNWYAAAVLIPVAIMLAVVAINAALGAPWPTAAQLTGWTVLPGEFLGILILIGIGEEAGWTAFAATWLLHRRSFLGAWAVLAAMRIVWHAPLMLTGDLPWILGVVGNAAFQFVILWLFVRSGQSWFVAAIIHSVLNVLGGSFFFQMVEGADQARLGVLMSVAYARVAVGLYLVDRDRLEGAGAVLEGRNGPAESGEGGHDQPIRRTPGR